MFGIKPLYDYKIYPTLNPIFVLKNVSAVLKATALRTRDVSNFSRMEIEIEIESRSSLFERSPRRLNF